MYTLAVMGEEAVTLRLGEETLARVAKVAEIMSERAGRIKVKRGTALRAAVERGLIELEQEFGLVKKTKKR